MRYLFSFLLIISTSLIFGQNLVKQPVKIPFELTNNGHIIIKAKVNGVEGKFVFDTGAGINLLTKDFADKVKDLKKTHHFHTGHRATGEEITTDLWRSKLLSINNFKIKKELFAVYDFKFPLDGLISLTPFKNQPITIDFKNKILQLESSKSLEKRIKNKDFEIPIVLDSDKEITLGIATYVNLEDQLPLLVSLDSGAGFGVYRFNARYMQDLGMDATKLKKEYRKSSFKPKQGNTFYFTTLAKMTDINKNAEVKNFKASFIEDLIYEGIMGIDWLGEKITIDIPNKRLIVQKQ
ncbi:retropepsin-like aspartic protease [Haloflavibacter putidus]|uniref:Aspartyl protease n=1 Tax=Haloflavibacter putidus TaxID=2576776 RepID=A0A507ZWN1_9FLAO|nr:retropepsin-like aspartic protease [Haloflavibacter putidus]TQD40674.1 hypothetical protein FKR84_01455 [Haloflavibacter putidus]